jgi:FeS assembly protein IscX
MLWTDVNEIAIELCEKYPEIDPQYVLFTDLRDWVIGLDGFKGHADRSNEKILEAIQMLWIEEMN